MNTAIELAKQGLITPVIDTIRKDDGDTAFVFYTCAPDYAERVKEFNRRCRDMDEQTIYRLCERWVSEEEPCVVYDGSRIIGLCRVGDPTATLVVRA